MEILIRIKIFISFLNNFKDIAKPNNKSKIAPNSTYNPMEKPDIKLRNK